MGARGHHRAELAKCPAEGWGRGTEKRGALTVYIDSPKTARPRTTCATFRGGWPFPSFGRRKWTSVPSASSKMYSTMRATPQICSPISTDPPRRAARREGEMSVRTAVENGEMADTIEKAAPGAASQRAPDRAAQPRAGPVPNPHKRAGFPGRR